MFTTYFIYTISLVRAFEKTFTTSVFDDLNSYIIGNTSYFTCTILASAELRQIVFMTLVSAVVCGDMERSCRLRLSSLADVENSRRLRSSSSSAAFSVISRIEPNMIFYALEESPLWPDLRLRGATRPWRHGHGGQLYRRLASAAGQNVRQLPNLRAFEASATPGQLARPSSSFRSTSALLR